MKKDKYLTNILLNMPQLDPSRNRKQGEAKSGHLQMTFFFLLNTGKICNNIVKTTYGKSLLRTTASSWYYKAWYDATDQSMSKWKYGLLMLLIVIPV